MSGAKKERPELEKMMRQMLDAETLDVTLLVTNALERLGILYVIIGSVAGAVHGLVRTTLDEIRPRRRSPIGTGAGFFGGSDRHVMHFRHPLLILGFILFLTACLAAGVSPEEKVSHVVSFGDACTAPCWETLVPGVSTEADFRKVVDSAPAAAYGDLRRQRLQDDPDQISYLWTNEEFGFFGGLFLKNGVVEHISFQMLQNDVTLSMLLEQLGDPDGYEATELENEFIVLDLYFEGSGVVVTSWFEHTLTELSNITSACEYVPDWDLAPKRLEIGLVEPSGMSVMAETMYWRFFTLDPRPWTGAEALTLTRCP